MTPRPPSPAELRAGRKMWGPKPAVGERSNPAPAPIVASNLKMIGKGTLVATADITIPKWGNFTIRGGMLHRKGDSEWFAFPSREWIDRNGQRQFADLLQFGDRPIGDRFKAAALAAMRELVRTEHPGDFGDGAAQPGSRPPRSRPAAGRLYSSQKQPRGSGPALPDDPVVDLWPDAGA
jgi:hypothetical protein